MKDIIFLGYIDEKRLIYNKTKKKYMYVRKEKIIDLKDKSLRNKFVVFSLITYPLIKYVDNRFVAETNYQKIITFLFTTIIVFAITRVWYKKVRKDTEEKFIEEIQVEASLPKVELINHLNGLKKQGWFLIMILVLLISISITFLVFFFMYGRFSTLLYAQLLFPPSFIMLFILNPFYALRNINDLIVKEENLNRLEAESER